MWYHTGRNKIRRYEAQNNAGKCGLLRKYLRKSLLTTDVWSLVSDGDLKRRFSGFRNFVKAFHFINSYFQKIFRAVEQRLLLSGQLAEGFESGQEGSACFKWTAARKMRNPCSRRWTENYFSYLRKKWLTENGDIIGHSMEFYKTAVKNLTGQRCELNIITSRRIHGRTYINKVKFWN